MKIKKILAGIDVEKDSGPVLAYASLFADVFGAALNLLHVIDYLVTPPAYLAQYIEKEEKNALGKINALAAKMNEAGFSTEARVVVGRLRESFEAAIEKRNADMLVLGFARHGFRRSSAERLIKGLRTPMLVVAGEKGGGANAGAVKIEKILCPVDFSDTSRKALGAARELTEAFSSKLDIVYVSPDCLLRRIRVEGEKERAARALRESAEESLREFLEGFGLKDAGSVEEGEPGSEIVSFAKKRDVDLIVIGARGLGFIEGMLIGSVTDAVLKSSPCPVFVIH